MNVIIANEQKMKSFMKGFLDCELTDTDFQDWIDYLKEYAEWVEECLDELEDDDKVIGINLTFEGEEEDYYVDVLYDFTDSENVVVDLDYSSKIKDQLGVLESLAENIKGAMEDEN